jgi:predicted Rossmann-fold nucleotide-binding protein
LAKELYEVMHVEHEDYPADWTKHGKSAGFVRNKQMLEEGKPDVVIAFPGGTGTAMMIKLVEEANKRGRKNKIICH